MTWYFPNSAMPHDIVSTVATQVAERTPAAIANLVKSVARTSNYDKIYSAEEVILNERSIESAQRLAILLNRHGSDKASIHNYHLIYGHFFALCTSPPKILEIGLGSNNTAIPSNMGADGKPGASLRAFKEFSPHSVVDGADIDSTIRVEGSRVFRVDQTEPSSFVEIKRNGEPFYDLVIDDGLHSPDANINTLTFGLNHISPEGVVIIEDIPERAIPIWTTIRYILGSRFYYSGIIKTSRAYIFYATRNSCFLP